MHKVLRMKLYFLHCSYIMIAWQSCHVPPLVVTGMICQVDTMSFSPLLVTCQIPGPTMSASQYLAYFIASSNFSEYVGVVSHLHYSVFSLIPSYLTIRLAVSPSIIALIGLLLTSNTILLKSSLRLLTTRSGLHTVSIACLSHVCVGMFDNHFQASSLSFLKLAIAL